VLPAHRQASYDVRFDWGLAGAVTIAEGAAVAVLVDVLSFTTTVSVAIEAGVSVFPYQWDDATAGSFAIERDAVLAVGRSQAGPGQISLSPASLRTTTAPPRLVLPSPNGSTIAARLGEDGSVILAASIRNATAVSRWIARQHRPATTVAVIAAGERWPVDGGLRPAVEDLWGAGAVIAGLLAAGWNAPSPEAESARDAYEPIRGRERHALAACASGRELIDAGFAADVDVAAEADAADAVPLLVDGSFQDARGPSDR
jgi:2-phosphosulfolactate phosphatase